MPDDTGDYLKKRARELNLGRADLLSEVQAWLDKEYPGKARAVSLNNSALKIITPSASVAGDLRLRQGEVIVLKKEIERLVIGIGTI